MPSDNGQGESLNVPMAKIIDQLHNRYGQHIAMLVQENSQLSAGFEQAVSERDEALAKLEALQG